MVGAGAGAGAGEGVLVGLLTAVAARRDDEFSEARVIFACKLVGSRLKDLEVIPFTLVAIV